MNHKIGLVFDGGGAKGAYQIGVWKALRELGLDEYVTTVSGSSVGGLNAALFVKGNFDEAEHIWEEEISHIELSRLAMCVSELIDKHFGDMSFFESSPIDCFITAYNNNGKSGLKWYEYEGNDIKIIYCGKEEYYNMRYLNSEDRKEYVHRNTLRKSVLLATSALPVFCRPIKVKLNDQKKDLRDGGIKDNSPVLPVDTSNKCDTVIIVHLSGLAESDREKFSGITVLEINPSGDTGELFSGTLNFNTKHTGKLINMGYCDSLKLFKAMKKNWLKEELSYAYL